MIYKNYLKRNCMLPLPIALISVVVFFCIFLFSIHNSTTAIIQLQNYNLAGFREVGIANFQQSNKNAFAYSTRIHVGTSLSKIQNLEYLSPQTIVEIGTVDYKNVPNLISVNFDKQDFEKLLASECSVSNDFAIVNNVRVGDTLTIECFAEIKEIKVKSIFSACFGLMNFDPYNTNGLIVFGEDKEFFSNATDNKVIHFATDENILYDTVVLISQLKGKVWSSLVLSILILFAACLGFFLIVQLVFQREKMNNYKVFSTMGAKKSTLRVLLFLELLIKFLTVIAVAFVGFQLINIIWITYFTINLILISSTFLISFAIIYLLEILKNRRVFL